MPLPAPGVGSIGLDRPDVLDGDAVDLTDLVEQQLERDVVGQRDDQLVDRAAPAALEDLDADDVTAHGADPARHLAESTGTVRQPDTDDERAHWCSVIVRRRVMARSMLMGTQANGGSRVVCGGRMSIR